MGQYFKVVNKTKKEYLSPYTFGNGAKMWEIVSSGKGVLQGLGLLLAEGHYIDGDETPTHKSLIGRWVGDSITMVGDYAKSELYHKCEKSPYKDISMDVARELYKDSWIGNQKRKYCKEHGTQWFFGDEKDLMLELFPLECHEGDLRQKFDFVEKEQSDE